MGGGKWGTFMSLESEDDYEKKRERDDFLPPNSSHSILSSYLLSSSPFLFSMPAVFLSSSSSEDRGNK